MGKSSKSRRENEPVSKSRGSYGSNTGSTNNSTSQEICAFKIKFEQRFPASNSPQVGQQAALLPNDSLSELDVIVNGKFIGNYSGQKKQKIIKCIGEGFAYEGEVILVKDNSLGVIEVTGRGQ